MMNPGEMGEQWRECVTNRCENVAFKALPVWLRRPTRPTPILSLFIRWRGAPGPRAIVCAVVWGGSELNLLMSSAGTTTCVVIVMLPDAS
jgi:hypothetical protein